MRLKKKEKHDKRIMNKELKEFEKCEKSGGLVAKDELSKQDSTTGSKTLLPITTPANEPTTTRLSQVESTNPNATDQNLNHASDCDSKSEKSDCETDTQSESGSAKGGDGHNSKRKHGERDPELSKAEWKAKIKLEKRTKREEKIPKSLKKKHKKAKQ